MVTLVKALETLYGSADMPSLAGRATQCLRRLFDCELAFFDLTDVPAVHSYTLVTSPALPNWEAFLAALRRHSHERTIITHSGRHAYPHAIRTSDWIDLRPFRQTGLYNEVLVPFVERMDRQVGFVNKLTETLSIGVSVNRRGKDFSAEERTLLELLRPHLLQAYRIAQAHHRMHEREQAVREDAAAAVDGGLCQIDAAGRMEWATAKVDGLLARYFSSWQTRSTRLPPEMLTLLRPVLAAGRKSAEDEPALGRSWCVVRPFGALRVRLASKTEGGRWQLLLSEDPRDFDAATLATRHGLSQREAEVLFWIGQGKTNEEIGIILSISRRTAQKHIERLFAKLQVDNRTAAARVALGK